ncbi:MAG: bifunctional 3'-5' exonuclease/DNA polymerase [Aquificae bacterium]|nr:bifunctional 3'-5' exonuclease/DNA polymerase [Aquificota bacterium]
MAFKYVTQQGELEEACRALSSAPYLFLDTETTREGKVRLLQLADQERVFVIDLFEVEDLRPLRELLSRKGVVGHNLKFDLKALRPLGIVPAATFDTMIASYLLGYERHSLSHLSAQLLGKPMDKSLQLSDWGAPHLSKEQLSYAARDVEVLRELFPLMKRLLDALKGVRGEEVLKSRTARTFRLESPVAVVEMAFVKEVASLEYAGFPVDQEALDYLLRELQRELRKRVEEFFIKFRVDPFSPKQVAHLLTSRFGLSLPTTAKGNPSTDDAFLVSFKEVPPVGLLLEIRRLKKLLEKLKEIKESARGGRVHPDFKQIGAVTGRMACARPNVQNVPRELRGVFKAPEGRTFVVADFSQIELRIAAELVEEELMIEAFREGKDLHRYTASLLLGKKEEEVSKEERQLSKAVNFGLIYGISARSLAEYARAGYGVPLTEEEARAIRRKFFKTFKAFKRWHEEVKERLKEEGEVRGRTLLGRPYRATTFTDAVNYPVQGTGADLLKLAVLVFEAELKREGLSAQVVNLVHDEIVAECDKERAHQVKELLEEAMKKAGLMILKRVPVEAESVISERWEKD